MKKYYHELTLAERIDIYNRRAPWSQTAKDYPQPPWCSHKNAVNGLFGCDDLVMTGFVKNIENCENCKFLNNITDKEE